MVLVAKSGCARVRPPRPCLTRAAPPGFSVTCIRHAEHDRHAIQILSTAPTPTAVPVDEWERPPHRGCAALANAGMPRLIAVRSVFWFPTPPLCRIPQSRRTCRAPASRGMIPDGRRQSFLSRPYLAEVVARGVFLYHLFRRSSQLRIIFFISTAHRAHVTSIAPRTKSNAPTFPRSPRHVVGTLAAFGPRLSPAWNRFSSANAGSPGPMLPTLCPPDFELHDSDPARRPSCHVIDASTVMKRLILSVHGRFPKCPRPPDRRTLLPYVADKQMSPPSAPGAFIAGHCRINASARFHRRSPARVMFAHPFQSLGLVLKHRIQSASTASRAHHRARAKVPSHSLPRRLPLLGPLP